MMFKRVAFNAISATRCVRRPVARALPPRIYVPAQSIRVQPIFSYLGNQQSGTAKTNKDSTLGSNEALDWLKRTSKSFTVFIPGASRFIDSAFNDLDAVRAKHGREVDNIIQEAYSDIQGITKGGTISILNARKAYDALAKHLTRIASLSGNAAYTILDNHPQLKEIVGPTIDKLNEYGRNYGPEAQREVDRTWEQISDIIKSGVTPESTEKIRKVVQEKVEKLKQLSDKAWEKGMEQVKPFLDKNPTVKRLIEENADALQHGNVQELYQKIKTAVESGNTADLELYVRSTVAKVKDGGFAALHQYLNKIPGGDQIIPKLSQIQEAADKYGGEAQKILKGVVSEISEILEKNRRESDEYARQVVEEWQRLEKEEQAKKGMA